MNNSNEKPYGEMLAEHICGIRTYTDDQLSQAARRHVAAVIRTARKSGYEQFASMPGVIRHPDGVLEIPTEN